MAPNARQLARSAFVFWVITTLTCTSQIALIAITIGLATNNAPIEGSIHRTAWVTAAANMVALTASLGAVCLYVRRTERITYIALCTVIILLSALAALLTIYTLTWIWNYIRNMDHPNSRYVFTKSLSTAGFAVWSVSFIAQTTLFTLVFWPKQQQIAPPNASRTHAKAFAKQNSQTQTLRLDVTYTSINSAWHSSEVESVIT